MTIAAGQPILAQDLLDKFADMDVKIGQNTHNIIQLYIQQYFEEKYPQYAGIWFDAFSDNTKAVGGEATLASAASGQKNITIAGGVVNPVAGMPIKIYDATNAEDIVVDSVANHATLLGYDEANPLFSDDFANGNTQGWVAGDQPVMTFADGVMKNTSGNTNNAKKSLDLMPYVKSADNTGVKITGTFKNTYFYSGNQAYEFYPFYVDSSNDMKIYFQAGTAGYNTITIYDRDGGSAGSGNYSAEAGVAGDLMHFEFLFKRGSSGDNFVNVEVRIWKDGNARPTTAQATSANCYAGNSTSARSIMAQAYTSSSGGGVAQYDNIKVYEGSPAKTITAVSNLANTYAAGSIVGRTTANINTGEQRLDMNPSYGSSYVSILTDTFDRANSDTVGNGWSENEASASYVTISSNELYLYNSGGNYASIYRTGQKKGIKLKITGLKFSTGGNYTNHFFEMTTKGNGTVGSGLGVRFRVPVSTSNPANTTLELVDSGTVIATTTIQRYYNDYHTIELIVGTDYAMEVRTWVDGGSRPSAADLTSAARTPTASGDKHMLGASFYTGWNINVRGFESYGYTEYLSGATTMQYVSEMTRFAQEKSGLSLWVSRNFDTQIHPTIAPAGTTVKIAGNYAATMGAGVNLDLLSADGDTRERHVVSAVQANNITSGTAKSLLTAYTGSKHAYRNHSGSDPLYISNIYSTTKTFHFAIKTTDYRASKGIFANGGGSSGYTFELRWSPTNSGKVQLRIIWNSSSSYEATVESASAINDGTTHYIACTIGSGGVLGLYVDGVLQGTATPPSTTNGTCSNFYIGRNDYDSTVSDIYFDDFSAWDSVLSQSAIAALMGKDLVGNESGLLALYKFDSNVNDSTASAKNLTASGTPTYQNPINTIYETQITTTSSIVGSFTTSDYVERVDVVPYVSLVPADDAESMVQPVFVASVLNETTGEVEDEYSYAPTVAGQDLTVRLDLSRLSSSVEPYARLLGVALN